MPDDQQVQKNLRAEYQALGAYFNVITTIRFTVLGALLAAVALVSSHKITRVDGGGIMLTGLALWWMELRGRALSRNMAKRAVEIERDEWQLGDLKGFYGRQWKFGVEKPTWDEVSAFGCPKHSRGNLVKVSYSVSFDVLFAATTLYGICRIIHP